MIWHHPLTDDERVSLKSAGWEYNGSCGCVCGDAGRRRGTPDPDCTCRGTGRIYLRPKAHRKTCDLCADLFGSSTYEGGCVQIEKENGLWWYLCGCQPSPFEYPEKQREPKPLEVDPRLTDVLLGMKK